MATNKKKTTSIPKIKSDLSQEGLVLTLRSYALAKKQSKAHTKTRGEVRGGGRKPWRQKGTGRARAGSIRSPLWKGGGVTFGPRKAKNYQLKINQKLKKQALKKVLGERIQDKTLFVVKNFSVSSGKTKEAIKEIGKLGVNNAPLKPGKITFVLEKPDEPTKRSLKNLPGIKLFEAKNLNAYEAERPANLVIEEKSLERWQ